MRLFIAINFNDYIKNELCSVMENLKNTPLGKIYFEKICI